MARRRKASTKARVHSEHLKWLKLVEVSGPFLSPPILGEALPQGLVSDDRDVRAELSAAHEEWREKRSDRAIHHAWIEFVLERALEFEDRDLAKDVPPRLDVREPLHGETLSADFAVLDSPGDDGARPARLLVSRWPAETDLEKPVPDRRWKSSPLDRMVELLRNSADRDLSLGLVTNGERWTLVVVPREGTSAFVSWYADLWFQEPVTLRALRTFLGADRFFGDPNDTLERLIERSADQQYEVTDQLGLQVREAIELLVQAIDQADRERSGALLTGIDEKTLYEAAVTVMMRLVFVFYAEEQGLLPLADSPLYRSHYALGPLSAELRSLADKQGEDILERRRSAWPRMLATFRAIHGGVQHHDFQMVAHGGGLFDPNRFAFLEGRAPGSDWRETEAEPLPINDRMALLLLEALQVLRVSLPGGKVETRRLSFREIGVEQIGHVYEGLLDHTVIRSQGTVLSLKGRAGEEPEVELDELRSRFSSTDHTKLVSFVKEQSGRTPKAIEKDLPPDYEIKDEGHWLVACDGDPALWEEVRPFAGLVREDRSQRPVVIREGSAYVTAGTDRRSTGTHYTPPSLTEPIVQYALEPLVYEGPSQGAPPDEWRLRSPREILELKVCDLACGSGAFLVQGCRYLAERLVEAWSDLESAHPDKVLVSPEGEMSTGRLAERAIPKDDSERKVIARRAVAERCVYGVDRNSLAVEMAKLSLWLVTMQVGKPFEFLDHAIKWGDSLLGVTAVRQLEQLALNPEDAAQTVIGSEHVRAALNKAQALRTKLETIAAEHFEHVEVKARLSKEADEAVQDLRRIADALVGAALASCAKTGSQSQGEFKRLVELWIGPKISDLLGSEYSKDEKAAVGLTLQREAEELLSEASASTQVDRKPFHWLLEFPEVFGKKAGSSGFDALVGNPPYLGSMRISKALGDEYLRLIKSLWPHERGNADLVVYFLLRATLLVRKGGVLGMIVKDSVAEGKSCDVGLRYLVERAEWNILRAVHQIDWPGEAGTLISLIHLANGRWGGVRLLGRREVSCITPELDDRPEGDPLQLKHNAGMVSQGTVLLGDGFSVENAIGEEWTSRDPRYKDRLTPFLNGQDLNNSPSHHPRRMVLCFDDCSLEEVKTFPDAYDRIVTLVKPKRDRLTRQIHEECYWKHWDKRSKAYEELRANSDRAIVIPVVSKYVSVGVVPSFWTFSNKIVFLTQFDWGLFAALQSCFHRAWARYRASSMGDIVSYSISKCFKTLPLPAAFSAESRAAGKECHDVREQIASSRQLGITGIYNLMHDPNEASPDISELRRVTVLLDTCVAADYGMEKVPLDHTHVCRGEGTRFGISAEQQTNLYSLLLELNHRRYAEEAEKGWHKKKSSSRRAPKGKSASSRSRSGPDLFGT